MPRGGFGELEQAIMEVVWASDRPVTGREVVDQLDHSRPVAYTTVLTVMDRLARKGILTKHPTGKAHTYHAIQSRETYTAQRMASLLGASGNPATKRSSTVAGLPLAPSSFPPTRPTSCAPPS